MKEENKSLEIKKVRAHSGMSQSQFANYFHINISTLQMWEQGINRTPDSVLFMVKRILELEGRPFVDDTTTEATVNE